MKIAKYLYLILLLLGWSGQLYARDPQLIGVLHAPGGKVACFELEQGVSVQSVAIQQFEMTYGEKTTVEPVSYVQGNYFFVELPLQQTDLQYAYEFDLVLSDGTQYHSSKYDDAADRWFDWLGTDIPWNDAASGVKGRDPLIDAWYSPWPEWANWIGFNRVTVYKALVTCAEGHFVFDFPADSPYDLLKTGYGLATYDPETWYDKGNVHFIFSVNGETKTEQDMYAPGFSGEENAPYVRYFETPLLGATQVKLAGTSLDGKTDGDIMVFALPRVYFKEDTRTAQTLDWHTEKTIDENRPFKYTLTAKSSVGLPVHYRLVYGSQYASLSGSVLDVHTIPENDYIEVEAFQPGTDTYKPSDIYRCRFVVSGKKIVAADEVYALHENEEVGEIIVKGNKESVGQVSVENGSANVGRLVLQYTFVPGEWNFISFPSNADLNKITNLEELGYVYNKGNKAFYVLEYNTKKRAQNPAESAWTRLSKPSVLANKGYIMGVSRSDDNPDNEPVTVTFTFDNLTLDLNKEQNGVIGVNMDFYQVEPGSKIPVYIKPANGIKGNNLKFDLEFTPQNLSNLPMNYSRELEQCRITFNPNRSGIRITLPTSETAKVLIFDHKERLVKAVRYESPFLIDIKDLKKGTYQVLVQYGDAREFKELVIE